MNPDLVPMLLDVSIDPCDGSVHPSLQYVLIRGFTAMGWEQPRSASEDMAMEILKMIRPSRLDAGGGVREALEKTSRALEELKAIVWGECPSLLNEDSGGNARLDIDIDEALEAAKAALSTPSDAVNESAEARLREAILTSIDMIEGCHDAPKNPDSLPEMVKVHLQQALSADGDGHDSDCATHNEPAYPHGPCNCSAGGDGQLRDPKTALSAYEVIRDHYGMTPAGGDEAKKSEGRRENQPEGCTGPHRESGETNSGITDLGRSALAQSEEK